MRKMAAALALMGLCVSQSAFADDVLFLKCSTKSKMYVENTPQGDLTNYTHDYKIIRKDMNNLLWYSFDNRLGHYINNNCGDARTKCFISDDLIFLDGSESQGLNGGFYTKIYRKSGEIEIKIRARNKYYDAWVEIIESGHCEKSQDMELRENKF